MPNLYDYDEFQSYLFELESALSLASLKKCRGLEEDTPISAAIYALLRATSLFRASLSLVESRLDGCRGCCSTGVLGGVGCSATNFALKALAPTPRAGI